MKIYYYVDKNGQQAGPVPGELLVQHGVTAYTNVWCEGMTEWQKAIDVPELKALFTQVPPTPPKRDYQPTPPTGENCPENYLVWAILATILCCWPFGIPAIVYATKVEGLWKRGDKFGAKECSDKARMWCIISLIGGILSLIVGFFYGILMGMAGL